MKQVIFEASAFEDFVGWGWQVVGGEGQSAHKD